MELGLERVQGGEAAFGAEHRGVEEEGDGLSVEVAGESGKVGFEEGDGFVFEGGGGAEVDERGMPGAVGEGGEGAIDATGEGGEGFAAPSSIGEIEGGEPEGGRGEVSAVGDGAGEAPRAAEHGGCVVEAAFEEGCADAGGSDASAPPEGVGLNVDGDAEGLEEGGRALRAASEAPVLPAEEGEALEASGEVFGGEVGEFGGKGEEEGAAGGVGAAGFVEGVEVLDAAGGAPGVERGGGEALKGENGGGEAVGVGVAAHGQENGLVAEVKPVEGADGEGGAGREVGKGAGGAHGQPLR